MHHFGTRSFLHALAAAALLCGSLLAAPPSATTLRSPDAKVLRFPAYDSDAKKPVTFQIDDRRPGELLIIGDKISKTKFKLVKFELKERKNIKSGETEDVSELTVVNTTTHDEFVLVPGKVGTVR